MNDITTVATVSPLFAALEMALYSLIDARIATVVEPLVARIAELEKGQVPFDFESEAFVKAVEKIAGGIAEDAAQLLIDDHTSEYDHDDFADTDGIRDAVNDCLSDATVEIRNVTIRV